MAYAWAPIDAGEKKFKLGDSVSASDLGVEDANFQALLDSGAVREYEPPKMPATFQGSVLDYVREQRAKKRRSGRVSDDWWLYLCSNLGRCCPSRV